MKDDVIARFRREMLGPMVAHMTDEEVAAWLKPFTAMLTAPEALTVWWWVKERDEARVGLLRVLAARAR